MKARTTSATRAKHLAAITAAFDRASASPDASVTQLVGSMIIEQGETGERFLWGGWTDEQIRSSVCGYAQAAPPAELTSMAHWARKEIRWVEWWDLAGHDECSLCHATEALLLPEREARRAAVLA